MPTICETASGKRWLLSDKLAGVMGLIIAAALVISILMFQDYSSRTYLFLSLFIFPVPVTCGLAVGLISPRKAVVWAPLWASISVLLVYALLSGCIRDLSCAYTPAKIFLMILGVLLSAGAGYMGQLTSLRGHKRIAILLFFMLCAVAAVGEVHVVKLQMMQFEQDIVPQVSAQVDQDYIRLPVNLQWNCRRRPRIDCYDLTSNVDGRSIFVRVDAAALRIIGVRYCVPASHRLIRSKKDAKACLKQYGIRDRLLSSLDCVGKGKNCWKASLDETSLVLSKNGAMELNFLPK